MFHDDIKKFSMKLKNGIPGLSTLEQVMQRPRKGVFPVEQMRTTKNFTRYVQLRQFILHYVNNGENMAYLNNFYMILFNLI